jgi:hypothetical protein
MFVQQATGDLAGYAGALVHLDFKPENVMVGDDAGSAWSTSGWRGCRAAPAGPTTTTTAWPARRRT